MANDRVSFYRVARLSVFPPREDGGNARYALTATRINRGVPTGTILVDGVLPNSRSFPTTEELLEMFDAAIRAHMLVR